MPAIVLNDHRIVAADYFRNDIDKIPLYVWIGKTSPWPDESDPPDVTDSVQDKILAYEELVGMKRINSANVVSVVPRINWTSGQVYDEYRHDVNLIDELNPETDAFYNFYVITDEFNVYKCLSNSYRSVSTVQPSGTSTTPFETIDGYKWKFMYTVRATDAFDYMTPNWMPCYTLFSNDGSSQWLVQQAAVSGTIDNINVTDNGANYNTATSPTVTITGDGTGATASLVIDNETGTVTDIVVTDPGSGYTNATVTISDSGGSGVGAQAEAIISPLLGHGNDARSELGAIYLMLRVVFDSDEGGVLPIDISYRRSGIIYNPLSVDIGTILTLSTTNLFQVGETVTGGTSGATGDIRVLDANRNQFYLENTVGTFNNGETISSQTYNSAVINEIFEGENLPVTASVIDDSSFIDKTGSMLYISTRERITRGENQVEETRYVVQF